MQEVFEKILERLEELAKSDEIRALKTKEDETIRLITALQAGADRYRYAIQIINQLAEEQGLLLRLPTEAYFIKNNNVCKGWVQEVVCSVCRKLLLDIRYDDNSLDSYRGYVGNTVFLTKAEAEQKLKEKESD